LQHAIFLTLRPILFIIYSILTCCCDKGQEFGENEEFDDRIISFKFIEYETEHRGGFANYAVGMQELTYQRNMSQV